VEHGHKYRRKAKELEVLEKGLKNCYENGSKARKECTGVEKLGYTGGSTRTCFRGERVSSGGLLHIA